MHLVVPAIQIHAGPHVPGVAVAALAATAAYLSGTGWTITFSIGRITITIRRSERTKRG